MYITPYLEFGDPSVICCQSPVVVLVIEREPEFDFYDLEKEVKVTNRRTLNLTQNTNSASLMILAL